MQGLCSKCGRMRELKLFPDGRKRCAHDCDPDVMPPPRSFDAVLAELGESARGSYKR